MRLELSEYRGVWLFALFDLPVDDKTARRDYTRFRNLLLKEGFNMLQFSVYARYFASEAAAEPPRKRLKKGLPPAGQVRLLLVTDRQFGKMEIYHGRKRRDNEAPPDQMLLF
jgi:CRISPR-associated protein Cas2